MHQVELTTEQQVTIENAFKSEYLKDEIALSKLFDEYDFDSLDDDN